MNTIQTLEQADGLCYDMRPQDAGQIVEVSYCHHEDGYLYCRTYDRSDLSLSISRCAVDEDSEQGFEPQNGLLPATVGDDEELLPAALIEMIATVERYGERFTGGVERDAAQGWIDAGFSAHEADEWMEAGWWDCDRASTARDLGLTPDQTVKRAAALEDACDDAAEEYTDGSVIYSINNCDTDIDVLLAT